MAFTPGPWHLMNDGREEDILSADGTHVVCFGHDYDDYGGIGARWFPGWNEPGRPEHENEKQANRRLIAAAPDLLDVCKDALAYAEEWLQGAEAHHAKLRAAIAKAEGRTHPEEEGQ